MSIEQLAARVDALEALVNKQGAALEYSRDALLQHQNALLKTAEDIIGLLDQGTALYRAASEGKTDMAAAEAAIAALSLTLYVMLESDSRLAQQVQDIGQRHISKTSGPLREMLRNAYESLGVKV